MLTTIDKVLYSLITARLSTIPSNSNPRVYLERHQEIDVSYHKKEIEGLSFVERNTTDNISHKVESFLLFVAILNQITTAKVYTAKVVEKGRVTYAPSQCQLFGHRNTYFCG